MNEIQGEAEARGHEGTQAPREGEAAELTAEQKTVMAALLAGLNPASAARAAGVHRSTVSRWISQGGDFHRMWREEQVKKLREIKREAQSIAAEAASVVVRAIHAGDVRAAIAVLKALGVFETPEENDALIGVNVGT